ncbi:MAG: T9SS type A sorting domain-containing protein [bacterium]|nr:T9SS type A sorting domain-containing protein [bacterium]
MNRKEFLKLSGLAGAASVAAAAGVSATALGKPFGDGQETSVQGVEECVLIPSETAGPFPLDLSKDLSKFRQDMREDQDGVIHRMKMKIVSTSNCSPITNARVDLWHCNAYGYYSGFRTSGQNGSQDHTGATWLRGIQMTDANGEVNFITIFPGWYPGRTIHMHFQVFLSSVLSVTSQLAYPVAETNALLTSNQPYAVAGPDPTPPSSDGVFADGYAMQTATLVTNTSAGGYDSFLQVAINAPSTGLINLEPETGGQFTLGQNYPNPFTSQTVVPFTLVSTSDVVLDIFDLAGRKVTSLRKSSLPPGPQTLTVNLATLGLADAAYVYQLEVTNNQGDFRQCKVMTRARN